MPRLFHRRLVYPWAAALSALLIAACGGADQAASGSSTDGPSGHVTLGAGVAGGSYFALGGMLSELIGAEAPDIQMSVLAGANTGFIRQGADCMFQQADTVAHAWSGDGGAEFEEGESYPDLRLVGVGYSNTSLLLAKSGIDIESSADLGPDVTLGVTSPQYEGMVTDILSKDEDEMPKFTVISGFDSLMTALIQGNVDVVQVVGAHPLPNVLEASNTREFEFIPWDQGDLEDFIADFPYYPMGEVDAGAYNFLAESVDTWSRIMVVVCQKSVPEDVVYEITKLLYEHTAELEKAVAQADEITLDTLQETLDANAIQFPVHPGAERYWAEHGIAIPDTIPE